MSACVAVSSFPTTDKGLFFAVGLLALLGVFSPAKCENVVGGSTCDGVRFLCKHCVPKVATDAQRKAWENKNKPLHAKQFGTTKKTTIPRHGSTGCKFVKELDETAARSYPDISDEYSTKAPKVELPENPQYWRKAKHYDSNVWLRSRRPIPLDAFRSVFTMDGRPFFSILDRRIREDQDSRGFALGHRLDVPGDVSVEDMGTVPNATRNTTQEPTRLPYDWGWWREHHPTVIKRYPPGMRESIRWAIDGRHDFRMVARQFRVNADKLHNAVKYCRRKIPLADGEN
jgi:hypothetical protein